MPVEMNHTIIWCRDQAASANFYAEILGRPAPMRFSVFHVVALDNNVSLDFHTVEDEVVTGHYAFLIGENDFDAVLARVKARGLTTWADPAKAQANQTYRHNGGRGFYFEYPDGDLLEVLTRPYAAGSAFAAG